MSGEPGTTRLAREVCALLLAALEGDTVAATVLIGDLNMTDTAAIIAHLATFAAGLLEDRHGHAEALALLQRHALELAGTG